MAYKKLYGKNKRVEPYGPLIGNHERYTQTATLLAPLSKRGVPVQARVAVLGHLLNWWPYREKCGSIGEWVFKSHETLARKCGITTRQSQDAVADLRRLGRIETKTRKVSGQKTLHLRPSVEILKFANHLASYWKDTKAFQLIWDEALNLDLAFSEEPQSKTLFHLMREWDQGKDVSLLVLEVKPILETAEARVPSLVPLEGDEQAPHSPSNGTPAGSNSPSEGKPKKETENSETEDSESKKWSHTPSSSEKEESEGKPDCPVEDKESEIDAHVHGPIAQKPPKYPPDGFECWGKYYEDLTADLHKKEGGNAFQLALATMQQDYPATTAEDYYGEDAFN